ncbi:hypothetical protein [Lacipirellula sp.]|uniref:hypothetical protein n=1 Tax=Lacipirellula sp. TaxID=2691419 RepID=UPI003D120373
MTLDEAKHAAKIMAGEKGVVLGELLWSQAAIEEGAWALGYAVTDESLCFSWNFLLRPSRQNEIMVCAPNVPKSWRPGTGGVLSMKWKNVLGALFVLFAALAFLYATGLTVVLVQASEFKEASFVWAVGAFIAIVLLVASGIAWAGVRLLRRPNPAPESGD